MALSYLSNLTTSGIFSEIAGVPIRPATILELYGLQDESLSIPPLQILHPVLDTLWDLLVRPRLHRGRRGKRSLWRWR